MEQHDIYVGIDVAKARVDVVIRLGGDWREVSNDQAGIAARTGWNEDRPEDGHYQSKRNEDDMGTDTSAALAARSGSGTRMQRNTSTTRTAPVPALACIRKAAEAPPVFRRE